MNRNSYFQDRQIHQYFILQLTLSILFKKEILSYLKVRRLFAPIFRHVLTLTFEF